MENRSARLTFLLPLLFVLCSTLYGQENSWFLDRSPRFIQRLTWTADEYALRYEVVIERDDGGAFSEILRESTGANYIEVSLAPGKYRYGITVFDLLGRTGPVPEWMPLEVTAALEPELLSFSPDHFNLDEDPVWELNLIGRNLSPDAEVYLRLKGSAEPAIVPAEYEVSAPLDTARLVFSLQQLTPGDYEVYIRNPGGLEAGLGIFKIASGPPMDSENPGGLETGPGTSGTASGKPVDFYIALDYMPLVSLYGELNWVLDQPIFPLGGQIRFGVVPFKWTFGYLGLELAASWHYFHSAIDDYEVSFNTPGAEMNILFQKWFSNRVMALVFRAGGGVGIATDLRVVDPGGNLSDTASFLIPRITAGVSFLYLISRSFFAEAGVDYTHWFTTGDPPPGYLRPRIGAGWRF